MHYDNIEIGTSDFRTLIDEAVGNGISIEPLPYYFKRLPDRDKWTKLNVAISDKSGSTLAYYCDPKYLELYPKWIRGCNSIGSVHPTLLKTCKSEHIIHEEVELISLVDLYALMHIKSIGYMKIDTEGHDLIIVNHLLDSELPLPYTLQFESNVLVDEIKYHKLVRRLSAYYPKIRRKQFDTLCTN